MLTLSFTSAWLPISARRDIAALGLIHRTLLGLGPVHFQEWFRLDDTVRRHSLRLGARHNRQLSDPFRPLGRDYLNRSIVGYIKVYNELPQGIVSMKTVKNSKYVSPITRPART